MANSEDNIKRVYQSALKYYSMPDYETFRKDMEDEGKRRRFYDSMSRAYTMPDFDTFTRGIGVSGTGEPQRPQRGSFGTGEPQRPQRGSFGTGEQENSYNSYNSYNPENSEFSVVGVPKSDFVSRMNRRLEQYGQVVDDYRSQRDAAGRGLRPEAVMGEVRFTPQGVRREYVTRQGESVATRFQQSVANTEFTRNWEATTDEGRRTRENREGRDFEIGLNTLWSRHDTGHGNAAERAWDSAEAEYNARAGRNRQIVTNMVGAAGSGADCVAALEGMRLDNYTDRMTTHDLDRMMEAAWANLGDAGQGMLIDDCYNLLRERYPEADRLELYNAARDLARHESDRRLYRLAVEKNLPKDAMEYFVRKVEDGNLVTSLGRAFARRRAGTTGDMSAREEADEQYRKEGHTVADVGGTVVGMMLDPTMLLSGGFGGWAGRLALKGAGRIGARLGASAVIGAGGAASKGLMAGAAARYMGSTLTGRIGAGIAGSAATLGTFEAAKEAESQLVHGGKVAGVDDTGHYVNEGYSAGAIAGSLGHGALMGAAIGWLGPVAANVSDRLVSGIGSTVGKGATRAGIFTGSTVLEGTIFSVPQWIEGGEDAWDVWTDNMAMMVGFKGKHMLKTAGGVLGDLGASMERPTDGSRNRMDFVSRFRQRMDAPSDGGLSLTKDEEAELRRYGYDLRSVVRTGEQEIEGSVTGADAPEIVSRLTELVKDGRVSEAARAKMYYYATGHRLAPSAVMRGELREDGAGGFVVESQGENGVITSRRFGSRKKADLELERIERQAELNAVEYGERYQMGVDLERHLQDACRRVADENGWDPVEVYRTCEEASRNDSRGEDKQFDEVQKNIIRKVTEAMGDFEESSVTDAMRGGINAKYGVDIDLAIRRDFGRRTPQEQAAIDEYIEALYRSGKDASFETGERERQEGAPEAENSEHSENSENSNGTAGRYAAPGVVRMRKADGTEVRGWLTGERDESGRLEYMEEGDRRRLHYATDEEMDAMVTEYRPRTEEQTEGQTEGQKGTEEQKKGIEGQTEGQKGTEEQKKGIEEQTEGQKVSLTGEPQEQEAPVQETPAVGNSDKVDGAANAAQAAGDVADGRTALGRLPRDENGEPVFEGAESPEHGWDALVEFAEGDAATAKEIADTMAEEKRKAYEKAQKQKPKGKTPTEILASKRVISAELAQAEQEYNLWQQMAGVEQGRQEALRAQQEAEARQRAAERAEAEKAEREARQEAARVEREALEGIPEWHLDSPGNARKRGVRRYNGEMITRQEPVAAVRGKEVEVKFSQKDLPKGHVAVIEASQLQPSHMQGQRNPVFFIDEAQPKDRAEEVSVHAAQNIAEGIRPEEITGSATAYTGAPTVNARGEVIQGNNRSDALRYLWENRLPEQQQAYKQYIIDNAEQFGLAPEAVGAMERPVLVNMLDVDDAEAIRLGQMTAQDTESGGIERMKAKNVAQKLGDKMGTFANMLLRSGDEEATFGQTVDRNGGEVLKWMSQVGAISATQYQSAFDSRGNVTAEAKNDLQKVLYESVFRGGSRQTEEMFDKLPAKAQRALLATAFRDMESPVAGRMLPEIQASVAAYNQLMTDPTFAGARKLEEALRAVETFKRATALDDRMEQYVPAENYSNFALHLAALYKAGDISQTTLAGYFNRMYDLAQGKKGATLFEAADATEYPLAAIVKEVLGIEYQPAKNGKRNDTNGSAAVALGDRGGQGGERGGTEPRADGEQTAAGAGTAERGGGTVLPVSERGGQGDLHSAQRPEPSDLPQTAAEGLSCEISEEVNEFGKPFVKASDGTADFGFVDEESGLAPLPIKLSIGENYKDENGDNHGYGYLHIEAGHRDEFLQNGFSSVEEFVESVARNYTDIKEGAKIGKNQTYLLEMSDEHNNTLFIQLSRDGKYWNVNSAGIFKKKYSRRKPKVYSKPAVGSGKDTDTTEVNSGQSKGATAPAGNSSETSERKVNESASEKQGSGAESSVQPADSKGEQTIQTAVEIASSEDKGNTKSLNTKGNERTDVRPGAEGSGRGGQQPRDDEPVGEGAKHEDERTDGGRMAGRGGEHIEPDSDRGAGVSGLRESEEENSYNSYKSYKSDNSDKASGEAKRGHAERMAERFGTPVTVVEDVESLPEELRGSKGFYDVRSGNVVVVLPNNVNVEDVAATVLHEVVGHKGLRELVGEERYDAFCDEVYGHLKDDLKGGVDRETTRRFEREPEKGYEHARRVAVDELFGRMAEKGFEDFTKAERGIWAKLKAKVLEAINKFLGSLKLPKWVRLGDNELRYMLWRSHEKLRGKGDYVEMARDVAKREELGLNGGEIISDRKDRLEAINKRFNEELQKQIDGTLPEGHIYQIGKPGAILRAAGFPDKPIELSSRQLAKKSEQRNHEFDITDVRNLPYAIQTPIAIFRYGDKSKSENVIVGLTRDGKQFVVGVHFNQSRRGNEVSDIRGLFPKENAEWLNWISQGKAEWLDKEKIQTLIDQQRTNLAEVDYLDLDGVAKLVRTFENPTITEGESFEVRMRGGETDDIWKDRSVGMQERITNAAIRLSANQQGDLRLRNEAERAVVENLQSLVHDMRNRGGRTERFAGADRKVASKVTGAMNAQAMYDRSTVKRVTDLARVLIQNGYLSGMTGGEMQKLLTVVRDATAMENVAESVDKMIDIMLNTQLRNGEATFGKMLSIRGSKVDARGVEVQGTLDVNGQKTLGVVKDAMDLSKDAIIDRMAEAENRMSDTNRTIADEAALEYAGLNFALEYVEGISESRAEEKALRVELRTAKEDRDAGRMTEEAYKQFEEATEDAIRKNKVERAEAYFGLVGRLSDTLRESIGNAKAFREAEKARVNDIHHLANSDMQGRPSNEHHKDDWKDKMVNGGIARVLFAPLGTFDQILRTFGNKSANGEGYLWNRFMRGWVKCRNKELKGVKNKFARLDAKAAELFGKGTTWGELIRMESKMPKASVSFMDGGEMREHELKQGNLMYIYMVDKMTDGRMKLRKMGITEENIAEIENFLDPRLKALGDWLQEEFLVDTRNEYNETHKRIFGASMAAIENYFPLKILANARVDKEEDVNQQNRPEGITTKTGSIIKRRVNNLALDVTGADALSVILDHVTQMEHWNAYAEWNRDLNTLRTYKRFRNQVINMTTVYGGGKELWKDFNDLCLMAAGEYRPPLSKLNKNAVNLAKGVTAAKVSFRIYTAMKQLLSAPAYIPEVSVAAIARSIANPYGDFKWCLENMPIFRERWESRISGDPRLLKTDMDWKMWRSRVMEISSRLGMSPNAFVDAVTVSIGAKAMYETRLKQYLREGYPQEKAEERAMEDATILFNQTQQSSESPFLSTMQVDKDWLSSMYTVFRNSAMSYTRQEYDAMRNLGRNMTAGQRAKSVEFMTKQILRDWEIDPEKATEAERVKAQRAAEKRFRRQMRKDVLRVATFGFILPGLWNLGAYLPYLIFGDDEKEKDKMWDDALTHALFGSVEGLTGGDVMSAFGNMAASGEWNRNKLSKDMPLASDINTIYDTFAGGHAGEGINGILNVLVQMGVGANPQSLTDAALAIMDAAGDDPALGHEAAICAMRILQVPPSQIDKMYFDEVNLSGKGASKYTPEQLARRYAEYRVMRGGLYSPWMWGDEEQTGRYVGTTKRRIKERQESQGDKDVIAAYEDYEARYQAVRKAASEAKNLMDEDYIAGAAAYAALADNPDYEIYVLFDELQKHFRGIAGDWFEAETPEQWGLVSETMQAYRAGIVKAMQAESEEERDAALDMLIDLEDRFYKEYESAGNGKE